MNIFGMIQAASAAVLALGCVGTLAALLNATAVDEWRWWGTAGMVAIVVGAAGLGLVS